MIKPGLVSVTFRTLSPQEIIDLAGRAGLEGIEWGGDVHVPPGEIENATRVAKATFEAGLAIPSYGSYYRVGESEKEGLAFEAVLKTALALKTSSIRIWAGRGALETLTPAYRAHVCQETRRIAALAEDAGVELSFEYHRNTLTETAESALDLLQAVGCDNVKIYWQPVYGMSAGENLQGLLLLLSYITNVHVFHWWPTNQNRHLLKDGYEEWTLYIEKLGRAGKKTRFAMIEFVKDDNVEHFFEDAAALRQLLSVV